jgi:hypothetical protein
VEDVIVNKVAESGIISLDLEQYYPKDEIVVFDLKNHLFMELILKEKDYREALKNTDWSVYSNKIVCITCTADAIIPMWAYMLPVTYLEPVAKDVQFGTAESVEEKLLLNNIKDIDVSEYTEKRVVIKGCGEKKIPEAAYVLMTQKLRPVVKSIMYGEPCSTVPIYKKK